MRSAQLKHRVTIQENTPTVGGTGAVTDSWGTLETVYMAVSPMAGAERIRYGQPVSTNTVRFTMRYRNDLGASDVEMHPKYRLSYDSRLFEILSVHDTGESHKWVEIIAREAYDRES